MTRAAWGVLAAIHLTPAVVLVAPGLLRGLYGVEPQGDVGVLLVHRGGLFLAVVAACTLALLDPGSRRGASVVVGISVASYLAVYLAAGLPPGPLRTIAVADLVALAPLGLVTWKAWGAAA